MYKNMISKERTDKKKKKEKKVTVNDNEQTN